MSIKSGLSLCLKYLGLTLAWVVAFTILAPVMLPVDPAAPPPDPSRAGANLLAFLAVGLLNTFVIVWVILRSRWSGWPLVGAVFVLYYGCMTFMSQIESAVFAGVTSRLPAGFLPALFAMGLVLTALFAPLAVWVLGKFRPDPAAAAPNDRLHFSLGQWAWRLALIVVAYEVLYFSFGYYVSWTSPAVAAYYGGSDPGSFYLQMVSIFQTSAWLPAFQVLRALLWAAIALPTLRMLKGRPWESAVLVGLAYAVLENSQHLLANPYMPDVVRWHHLVETGSSNFIFGLIVAGLLLWPGRAAARAIGQRLTGPAGAH